MFSFGLQSPYHVISIVTRPSALGIANQIPLNKMSLLSLEKLFREVIIPSCTYGLSALSNQLCEENYEFLDVVQGRLVKLWFGVSRFA